MTVDQVRGILGKETVSEPLSSRDATAAGPDVRFYGFGHPSPTTIRSFEIFVRAGKVISVNVFLSKYKTAEGIGVGSSLTDLIKTHGPPAHQRNLDKWFVEFGERHSLIDLEYANGLWAEIDRATKRIIALGI